MTVKVKRLQKITRRRNLSIVLHVRSCKREVFRYKKVLLVLLVLVSMIKNKKIQNFMSSVIKTAPAASMIDSAILDLAACFAQLDKT